MKNLLIFLFGAAVGAGGMLLWLRKDIKEELKKAEKSGSEAPENGENSSENDQEEPFTVYDQGENNAKIVAASDNYEPEKRAKVPYNTLFQGSEEKSSGLYFDPRDNGFSVRMKENDDDDDEDPESGFIGNDETDGGVFEIDKDDFMADDGYEQERIVYYRGDRIMATEDGTIITNPFILVGGEWDKCVGNYADRTAFIRNPRLATDYEIFVEDGLYSDEYGPPDGYREG